MDSLPPARGPRDRPPGGDAFPPADERDPPCAHQASRPRRPVSLQPSGTAAFGAVKRAASNPEKLGAQRPPLSPRPLPSRRGRHRRPARETPSREAEHAARRRDVAVGTKRSEWDKEAKGKGRSRTRHETAPRVRGRRPQHPAPRGSEPREGEARARDGDQGPGQATEPRGPGGAAGAELADDRHRTACHPGPVSQALASSSRPTAGPKNQAENPKHRLQRTL